MRRISATAAACACAVLLAACDRSELHTVRGGTLALTSDEFSLKPQRIAAKPGRLTIVVTNRGRLNHNLMVRRGKKTVVAGMQSIRTGETGKIDVQLKPGTYTLYCSISRHEDLGEYGTMSVR